MATMMLPEAPAPEPRSLGSARAVTIRAHLLPDEVLAKRQLRDLKRRLALALVILLGLLVAWYGISALRTSTAKSDLANAQHETTALQRQVASFGPLVTAQAESAAIRSELTKLMVGDLPWKQMLDTLRAIAPRGIRLTSVSGTITSGAASAGATTAGPGLAVLNQTGELPVGSLTIVGMAPDKNAVAAYIDALAKVTGLAAPFPASVAGQNGSVTFTANVIVTSTALGGRYAGTTATTQGGH